MTRMLLDTHVFLWYIEGSPQLSRTAQRFIERPDTERLISVASVWEMAIKVSIGRLESERPFSESVRRMLVHNRIEIYYPTLDEFELVTTLPFHHRDPFDRLIIAQSLALGIPLISGDHVFDDYGVDRRW
jgi:PIN domain nuclease of toxin-antitoxin system